MTLRTITAGGDTLVDMSAPVSGGMTSASISPEVGTGVTYATVDFNP